MLGYQWVNGGEGLVLRVQLQDSTTGQGKTGLSSASSGLIIAAILDKEQGVNGKVYKESNSTIETVGTLGTYVTPTSTKCRFAAVDGTNHPGLYEIQFDIERWSDSDAKYVTVSVSGASGLKDFSTLIQLSSVPADLRRVEGYQLNEAELSLRKVSIFNADGTAVSIQGGDTENAAMNINGINTGVAALVIGGNSAPALTLTNIGFGANSLPTVHCISQGATTGPAVLLSGSEVGAGLEIQGGTTSGDALKITTTDGDGLVINSAGSGKIDVNATLPDPSDYSSLVTNISDILDSTNTSGVVVATSSKNGYALSSAYDLYHADIQFTRDEVHEQDEYTVTWFKNGVRITGVIDDPMIQVVKRADGMDLVEAIEMEPIGTTGSYKHDEEESANRIVNGEAAIVIVTAHLDDATRSFARVVGRDAA